MALHPNRPLESPSWTGESGEMFVSVFGWRFFKSTRSAIVKSASSPAPKKKSYTFVQSDRKKNLISFLRHVRSCSAAWKMLRLRYIISQTASATSLNRFSAFFRRKLPEMRSMEIANYSLMSSWIAQMARRILKPWHEILPQLPQRKTFDCTFCI